MRWFVMALGLFFVLGLAAGCTPAYDTYCPQGYDTASRCHKSGDHDGRGDRDRGDREDHGESDGGSEGDNGTDSPE